MSKLYRLCLDFRELNSILDFPQQMQFTTIDDFLHTLKGKVVHPSSLYRSQKKIDTKPLLGKQPSVRIRELSNGTQK
jgi:hypothetical protein